jgi:predicted transcriptional regulator
MVHISGYLPPREATMPTTTSLKLPDDLKEKISTLAQGLAQTPHAYMVEAIAEKVARDDKRQNFLQTAHDSAAEVASRGVVYRAEDVHREFLARVAGKRSRESRPVKLSSLKRKA